MYTHKKKKKRHKIYPGKENVISLCVSFNNVGSGTCRSSSIMAYSLDPLPIKETIELFFLWDNIRMAHSCLFMGLHSSLQQLLNVRYKKQSLWQGLGYTAFPFASPKLFKTDLLQECSPHSSQPRIWLVNKGSVRSVPKFPRIWGSHGNKSLSSWTIAFVQKYCYFISFLKKKKNPLQFIKPQTVE